MSNSLMMAATQTEARSASRFLPRTALYEADLHNHTALSDGTGDPAAAYAAMRAQGLDIAAVTDHARIGFGLPSLPATPGSTALTTMIGLTERSWSRLGSLADRAHLDGSFVAIRGFEWSSPRLGHLNVWFSKRWIDPLRTGAFTEADLDSPWMRTVLGRIHPAAQGFVGRILEGVPTGAPSKRGLDLWFGSSPRRRPDGGGLDGLASFNHPGRDGCRFDEFVLDPWLVPRVIGIEVFNRDEDYLFEGTDAGLQSPINQALNAGWRLGMLGVSDEHEARWGAHRDTGRTGVWARELTRTGVREALTARRFFATTIPGLRLDVLGNGHRMGSVVPAQRAAMRLEIDLDAGPDLRGSRLGVQVLGPGRALPDVLACEEIPTGHGSGPMVVEVPLDVERDRWVMVRISDPAATSDPRARPPYDRLGRAVAYASPLFLSSTAR